MYWKQEYTIKNKGKYKLDLNLSMGRACLSTSGYGVDRWHIGCIYIPATSKFWEKDNMQW